MVVDPDPIPLHGLCRFLSVTPNMTHITTGWVYPTCESVTDPLCTMRVGYGSCSLGQVPLFGGCRKKGKAFLKELSQNLA